MKDKVSGSDLIAIREQAATAENYAIVCRNNTDRITREYLALQVEIVRLRRLISDYVNADELKKVLDSHRKWMNNDGGERANLYGADLSEANLRGADLSEANLTDANLYGANLSEANLYGANLSRANLYGANLTDANLSRANLYGANLYGANLRGANLSGADLRGANLSRANLYGANLRGANLRGANLSGADLRGANLTGANLTDANLTDIKLTNAVGGNHRIQCLQIDPYKIIVLDNEIVWGGCTKKTAQEWLDYDGSELNEANKKYLETITKPFIRMCIA